MPHIHTEPGHHDLTAGAYIIRYIENEPAILLHMHKKLKMYLQFGGHVELNETPWQTVIHELKEESGYGLEQLELLQPAGSLNKLTGSKIHPLPLVFATYKYGNLDHYHTDTSYGFVTHEPPKYTVDGSESQDIRLFTKAELLKAPSSVVPNEVKEISLHILNDCLNTWNLVSADTFVS